MSPTSTFVPSNYSVVPGIFIQSDPAADLDGYDLLNDTFGLIDKEGGWTALKQRVEDLNRESDSLTAYKLIYIARHGEGWHNVGEAKYGSEAWDCHWSKLNGDGNITWGPDPRLTPKGEGQARAVNAAWHTQIASGVPLPQSLYASPLQRSLNTLRITWSDILLDRLRPLIRERWRETIGVHTCDKRRAKSDIAADFPGFDFETTFSEHDQLWNAEYQETAPQQALRIQQALNELFATDSNAYISITAHSGVINAFLNVVGHRKFQVQTGGFVPVLVKAVGHRESSQPVITGGQSATAPVCISTSTLMRP